MTQFSRARARSAAIASEVTNTGSPNPHPGSPKPQWYPTGHRLLTVALIAATAIGCSGSSDKAGQLARRACQEWHQAFQNSGTGHLYEQRAVIDADQAARFDQRWDTLDSDLHAYFDAVYSSQVAIDAVNSDCARL